MTAALAELVAPNDISEFLQRNWTVAPLHIPGDPTRFRDLFNWDAFNGVLNSHYRHISYPNLRMCMDSVHLDKAAFSDTSSHFVGNRPREHASPSRVRALSRSGATLIVGSVNELNRRLFLFSNRLAREFGAATVNMNAYFSRRGKQAFSVHHDKYEVFVIQVEGQKSWTLYGPARVRPLRGDRSPNPQDAPPPATTLVLKKGHVLYIPRGYWHSAIARDCDSLHLTLGILCPTGVDFFRWLLDSTITNQEFYRRNLPLVYDPNGSNGYTRVQIERWLSEVRRSMDGILDRPGELATGFNEHIKVAADQDGDDALDPFAFP